MQERIGHLLVKLKKWMIQLTIMKNQMSYLVSLIIKSKIIMIAMSWWQNLRFWQNLLLMPVSKNKIKTLLHRIQLKHHQKIK